MSDTGGTGPLSRRPYLDSCKLLTNRRPARNNDLEQKFIISHQRLSSADSDIKILRSWLLVSPTGHLITFVLVKPNPKTPNIATRSCCAMTVVLRAQRLLPTSDAAVILDGAVVVNGDRIMAVGPWSELRNAIPLDASVEALGDVTLMPGLFDCHVWICGKLAIDRNLLTHLVHSRSIFLSTHCRCAPPPILC